MQTLFCKQVALKDMMEIVDGYQPINKIQPSVHYILNASMLKELHCNHANFGDNPAFLMESNVFRNQIAQLIKHKQPV